jgi:HPt (histidine-containing phosphotransfer) domain-containing protein
MSGSSPVGEPGGPIDGATVDQLLEAVGSDPSFLDELLDAYLVDSADQLAAARAAVGHASAEDLVRPAHTLKSSSATLGALVLAGIARELELAARAGSLADAPARLDAAEAEWSRVTTRLAELRDARWRTTPGPS